MHIDDDERLWPQWQFARALRQRYLPNTVFTCCAILRSTYGQRLRPSELGSDVYAVAWRKHTTLVHVTHGSQIPDSGEEGSWTIVLYWNPESGVLGEEEPGEPEPPTEPAPPQQPTQPTHRPRQDWPTLYPPGYHPQRDMMVDDQGDDTNMGRTTRTGTTTTGTKSCCCASVEG